MNVYNIEVNYQPYCVVATSMEDAVRAFREQYGYEPTEIKLHSKHCIVAVPTATPDKLPGGSLPCGLEPGDCSASIPTACESCGNRRED